MAKYRVGLIGCGLMGTVHARAYNENPMTEIVAAADPDPENLKLFCERFNLASGYDSYDEMFRKEQIDIAAPVLPVQANPRAVVAAARAGVKAVFCEKPIAANLEDADRMVEECRSRGIPFACGDAFRNYPQFWQAKEMIDAGELGEVRIINLYQPTAEISGGGCQGLSVMRLYADDADVDWVVGWVAGDPWSDEDQNMGGYVRFGNGIEAHIHSKPSARRGVEVICERGVFFSDFHSFHTWKLDEAAEPTNGQRFQLQEMEGRFQDTGIDDITYDSEGWRVTSTRTAASVQSIVDAVETGTEPRTSGDNMRRVLEIAIALRESHRRGHSPVKLQLEDRTLKLCPKKWRLLNKKEVFGEDRYRERFEVIKRTN